MFDVAIWYGERASRDLSLLQELRLEPGNYVLVTVHRAENTDDPRRVGAILEGLKIVSSKLPVLWPIHPRTRNVLAASGLLNALDGRIRVIDPVGYLQMVQLEKHAAVIATDSGGVQKEAFFYQVPCVTLRDETEWVELVESGWNRLAPPRDADAVAAAVTEAVGTRGLAISPYGDGDASDRIIRHLESIV
jgi:UDP-GlcNAc3NAcA epimerase